MQPSGRVFSLSIQHFFFARVHDWSTCRTLSSAALMACRTKGRITTLALWPTYQNSGPYVAVSCGYGTCFAVRTCDGLYHFIFSIDTQKLTRSTLALKLSVSPPFYPLVTATPYVCLFCREIGNRQTDIRTQATCDLHGTPTREKTHTLQSFCARQREWYHKG